MEMSSGRQTLQRRAEKNGRVVRQLQPPFVRRNPPLGAFQCFALRRAAIMARMLRDARVPEVRLLGVHQCAR